MGQTVTTLANENPISNSIVKPIIMEDVVLLCPGVWIGEDNRPTQYTEKNIRAGFENTEWEDMNLFLDHKDSKSSAVSAWVGFVRNVRMAEGELHGDLEIWHPLISIFLKQAKAKFGVSATMQGREIINQMGGTSEFIIDSFRSMSIVDEPGCKSSWLPRALSKGIEGDKNVVTGMSVEKILAAHGMLTSVNDGHSHTWKKDSKVTSESDGHTHPIDLETMKTEEVDGHSHNLLDKSADIEENAAHKKKNMDSNLKLMKGGKIVMEEVNKEKVEEVETKNLSSHPEESEDQEIPKKKKKSKHELDEEVKNKNLSDKVDKLTDVVASISETLKTLSAETEESKEEEPVKEETSGEAESDSSTESSETTEEESKEESKEESEESSEVEDANKELEKSRNELEKTKKELSSLKEELNSPDRKTLSSSSSNAEVSSVDANAGMLGFLRERANIPIY